MSTTPNRPSFWSMVIVPFFRLWPVWLIGGFFLYGYHADKKSEEEAHALAEEYNRQHPVLSLPQTGDLSRPDLGNGPAVAPLTIQTRSSGSHYFLKMVETISGRTAFTAFIRSGDTLQTRMPIGSYEMRYATGSDWHGPSQLFGPRTNYNKADSTFVFSRDLSGYSGYTVELILQSHGNLSTRRIGKSSF